MGLKTVGIVQGDDLLRVVAGAMERTLAANPTNGRSLAGIGVGHDAMTTEPEAVTAAVLKTAAE